MPRSRNDDLSDRQRDVLRLIAEGKTNAEIASTLGITLDGAKYHVSEIVSKLGAASREDAVMRWRARDGVGARFRRLAESFLLGVGWLKAGAAIAALAIVGVTVVAAVLVLRNGTEGQEPGLPDNAADALREAQAALDRADRYTLTVEQSNFILPGWGGVDGGTVQVADGGKTAQAILARTGEPGATYTIVLLDNETVFKRSTCETMFRMSGGQPAVLRPFLFGATKALGSGAGAAYVPGSVTTVETTLDGVGPVKIELDPSTRLPVSILGTSNGQPLRWTFSNWGASFSVLRPSGTLQERGPGGIPC